MPPAPAKTLSPAELAKLEHAFATDPGSEAYKPLAEAYLGMGRFMEAMVVCKKGVKAHPTAADARILLARVYADQGKDKKALEELAGALQVAPKDKTVLRMTGALQLKSGEAEAGKSNLLKAWEVDPEDADTKALLAQHKIEPPKPPEPEPTEQVPLPPANVGSQRRSGRYPTAQGQSSSRTTGSRPAASAAPPQGRESAVQRPPPPPTNGAQARGSAKATTGRRPAAKPLYEIEDEPVSEPSFRVPKSSAGRKSFLVMLVVVVVTSLGYLGFGQLHARTVRAVNKALGTASDQLKHDSFDSYKKACEAAEKALDADSSSGRAHAYLAYAWAIRWGEHGGGDDAKQHAEDNLQAAKKSSDVSGDFSYLVAADALVKTYSGKAQEAAQQLDEQIKRSGSQSALLFLTLGIIQMNLGDLEHARENLTQAQQMASSDPRVYAALGTLYRRRGEEDAAARNYDFALRYERDHAESVLGYALLALEQENPKFEAAAKVLKRLIDSDPPPSPRQLAAAHLARAYLISRVSAEIQSLAKAEDQKELSDKTGVPTDKNKAAQEVSKEEDTGFTLDRSNPELHLIKGRRLLAEGQVDAAVSEIKAAIKMDGSRANFYVELAKALLKKDGGGKEATDALNDAIKRMGDSPKLMVMLAQVDRKMGKLDDAIAEAKRALSKPDAKNPEARLVWGSAAIEAKKCQEAVEQLSKASAEYVGQATRVAWADEELGRAYACLGDRAKADDAFKKALNADANFVPSYFFYGQFLMGSPTTVPQGKATLKKYLELDPHGAFAPDAQKLLAQ
jgi:tetratricopeptide (TPR) repeat protein